MESRIELRTNTCGWLPVLAASIYLFEQVLQLESPSDADCRSCETSGSDGVFASVATGYKSPAIVTACSVLLH